MTLLTTDFKQKNGWTCGPAIARIVFDHYGYETEISEMVRKLNTTRAGTSNQDLLRLLRRYDIPFRVMQQARLADLRRLVRTHLVIVAYWIPRHREAHYSIVKKTDWHRIYFHDTWFGSTHSYSLPYFEKNWLDGADAHWLLAVRKRR
ncbi:MAG: hypothetical protein A3A33_01425 [Candidatus Yanofskybacteria bacterium RIFCSPLOWO2_01_FULL_49_25]|uniref:Peptidase C39 domain-containing protein n=1 Tax=Candidatus Yanofskybacteria bacterium RIFCSPLOWO2_01_FULL_49_25 TaxID=1802701 RepID=A0A1F8GX34_9BACT|nr:MAG: hypothetical protein A3A33_01425 [Candidatus Yanofskybacteria bacterium RIFCSPLOWO2_01_FULL_49_25]